MTRRLRLNEKGLAVIQRWVSALSEAERAGEEVPEVSDWAATAKWLHDRGKLGGIPRDEAESALKILAAGGEGEFEVRHRNGT